MEQSLRRGIFSWLIVVTLITGYNLWDDAAKKRSFDPQHLLIGAAMLLAGGVIYLFAASIVRLVRSIYGRSR